jgi:hypothetical protein
MLNSTLTPDMAMPMLLRKHQSHYKWRIYCRVCLLQSGTIGSIYSVPGSVPWLGRDGSMEMYGGWPPHGRSTMSCGQTNLMKSVPHCRLLESVATIPLLIGHQSGADQPPPGPTWLGLGLTWPPSQWTPMVTRTLVNFPFRPLEKFQIVLHVPKIK